MGTLSTQYQVGSFTLGNNYTSGSSSSGNLGISIVSGVTITAASKILISQTSKTTNSPLALSYVITKSTAFQNFTVTAYATGILTGSQTLNVFSCTFQHGLFVDSSNTIPQFSYQNIGAATSPVYPSGAKVTTPQNIDIGTSYTIALAQICLQQQTRSSDASTFDYVIIG